MRGRVLEQRDLQERTEELRRSFTDEDDGYICTCMVADDSRSLPPPAPMDARERKWVAAKLLRPVNADTAAELDGLSAEENLMVHEEYWAMTVGRLENEPGPNRFKRLAAQYTQTKVFALRAWRMASVSDLQDEP
ncbi:hypothetical protein ILP92_17885 [Maribius pontilimi]|uniref:Uncharacterized protein n=1 Tax=Palleronia pontilimi TaxID=1964209 RepID=A0A934IKG7_9RHOB|nr:hypothetical protein [Palleronia pontilimi]MBJ3764607.1 hypothetical protein [Palleronia pontilimi]